MDSIKQFIAIGGMQIKQLKYSGSDFFTPWSDEQEQKLYQANSAVNRKDENEKKRSTFRRKKNKHAEPPLPEDSIEAKAKKTLLELDMREKSENIRHLQDYLSKKSRIKQFQHQEELKFRLPVLKPEKYGMGSKSQRNSIRNSRSLVMPNKIKPDNQEQEIFKKYGEHRKSPNQVERTISYGSSINNQRVIPEVKQKYSTIDPSRERQEFSPELSDLKLKGKKYSYDLRKSRGKGDPQISYMPSHPNITPLYLLFGQEKKEVLKKVFEQIQHKIK